MPAFFALSRTLVYHWFSDFDEPAAIAANFVVSSFVLIPVAAMTSDFSKHRTSASNQSWPYCYCLWARWPRLPLDRSFIRWL
jgi:hypothetical protein